MRTFQTTGLFNKKIILIVKGRKNIMTIETAVQKSSYIQIYGAHGRILGSIPTNSGDMLMGFTGSSVSVRKGDFICVYDEHGVRIGSQPI